jgi:ankyrin repeat protein
MNKLIPFWLILLLLLSCKEAIPQDKMLANDFHLFDNTPAKNLAMAIKQDDVATIRKIVLSDTSLMNIRESRFGQTVLFLSVNNEKYRSFCELLKLGANPNVHDKYAGTSPIILISGDGMGYETVEPNYLETILSFGGNPNDTETGQRLPENETRLTPLIAACHSVESESTILKKVKLLIDHGANINYVNEFHQYALREACLQNHFKVVYYLLLNGANYESYIIDRTQIGKGQVYLTEYLREQTPALGSEQHKDKMLIVKFLEKNGIDYRSMPIPDHTLKEIKRKYPQDWEQYILEY